MEAALPRAVPAHPAVMAAVPARRPLMATSIRWNQRHNPCWAKSSMPTGGFLSTYTGKGRQNLKAPCRVFSTCVFNYNYRYFISASLSFLTWFFLSQFIFDSGKNLARLTLYFSFTLPHLFLSCRAEISPGDPSFSLSPCRRDKRSSSVLLHDDVLRAATQRSTAHLQPHSCFKCL